MSERKSEMPALPEESSEQAPQLGGLRFGPALAGGLYALLVGSAALALFGQQFPDELPQGLRRAAPWVFLAFVICFALYRLQLVRARRYPAFKAFFQIGAALLFFTLLLPSAQQRYVAREDTGLGALLLHEDPRVRQLAAEVARHREEGARHAPALVRTLRDSDARVRAEAHRSLVKLAGEDLGSPEQPAALDAWEARFP